MFKVKIDIPSSLFEKKQTSIYALKQIIDDLFVLCHVELEKIVGYEESWAEPDMEGFQKEIMHYVIVPTIDTFLKGFKSFKRLRLLARKSETKKTRGKSVPQKAKKPLKRSSKR